jgi:metal-responsive CopG/Arc/MetJ family transcriptional regulator
VDEEKAKSKSVSLPPEMWKAVEGVAERTHAGNRSAFFYDIVKRELSGADWIPNTLSTTILVDMTRRLLGDLTAEEMERIMAGYDQRKELAALLRLTLEANSKQEKTLVEKMPGAVLKGGRTEEFRKHQRPSGGNEQTGT